MLCPPELREFVDTTRHYFRWIYIDPKKVKSDTINENICDSLYESIWVGNLKQQNKVQLKALPEIMSYIDCLENDLQELPLSIGLSSMIALFKKIDRCIKIEETNENELDSDLEDFFHFAFKHLIHQNE